MGMGRSVVFDDGVQEEGLEWGRIHIFIRIYRFRVVDGSEVVVVRLM